MLLNRYSELSLWSIPMQYKYSEYPKFDSSREQCTIMNISRSLGSIPVVIKMQVWIILAHEFDSNNKVRYSYNTRREFDSSYEKNIPDLIFVCEENGFDYGRD